MLGKATPSQDVQEGGQNAHSAEETFVPHEDVIPYRDARFTAVRSARVGFWNPTAWIPLEYLDQRGGVVAQDGDGLARWKATKAALYERDYGRPEKPSEAYARRMREAQAAEEAERRAQEAGAA